MKDWGAKHSLKVDFQIVGLKLRDLRAAVQQGIANVVGGVGACMDKKVKGIQSMKA